MLKSLNYTVQFSSTGRTLHEEINFEKGFGAITGPNESGKSMVLELVRWSLFGSAALRGSASDYVKIHGALAFIVKGQSYFVTRAHNGATLYRDKTEIATGTKPVNAKVVEVLGFGLAVFDIACAANQNALLALGQMTPANRKRLVDSVIGLGVIEDMGKLAGEEANSLNRRYKDLVDALQKPIEPIAPLNYVNSSGVRDQLTHLRSTKSELDQLLGWLSVDKPKVKRPEETVSIPAEQLQELVDTQNAVRAREKVLVAIPKPRYSQAELVEMHRQNDGYENSRRLKGLESRLLHLQKEQIECPSCGHQWAEDEAALKSVVDEIASLKQENLFSDKPADYPEMYVNKELAKLKDWDDGILTELEQVRRTLEKQPDFRQMLIQRQKYELALARYDEEVQSYDEWRRLYETKQARAKELELEIAELPEIQADYDAAREYESHLDFYNTVKASYDHAMEMAEEVKVESEDWSKAKVALADLRSKVKQHLVPSLNKVASHLLKEMTGGQRQSVVVDEEFNISVDGQPLNTLSGSGMAIANLAIRIGLGQVLTRNVFNVFMADEIDASMDETRARATANSLQNLRSTISQILLVTHKSPVADYYINLGKDHDQSEHSDS